MLPQPAERAVLDDTHRRVAEVLGHTVPTPLGWGLALLVIPALLLADAAAKAAGATPAPPDGPEGATTAGRTTLTPAGWSAHPGWMAVPARRVAVPLLLLVTATLLGRHRMHRWGATAGEPGAGWPGDGLVDGADLTTTRAVTVHAPAAEVWPWIAQLGQGRGGFYSYDAVENLVGCDIHSADRIVPEWQAVTVGDEVRLAPGVAMTVAAVEPGRSLVLRGGFPLGSTPSPFDSSWSFVLRERPDGTTRLVSRERYGYLRWWAALVVEPTSLVSFIMTRRMLRGIAERAERRRAGPPWRRSASGVGCSPSCARP